MLACRALPTGSELGECCQVYNVVIEEYFCCQMFAEDSDAAIFALCNSRQCAVGWVEKVKAKSSEVIAYVMLKTMRLFISKFEVL